MMEVNKTLPKDKQVKIVLVEDWNEIFEKYESEIFKGIAVDEDLEKLQKCKKCIKRYGGF